MTHPNVRLLRRYVVDYVNRQDFSILPEIMAQDYALFTGDHRIIGRDGDYRAAVERQFRQFPGLTFTPHELLVSGDTVAVRFSEHGASHAQDGRRAVWPGIAIYTIANKRLVSCHIEQDYHGRRRQIADGTPTPVDPPATAPWDSREQPPSPANEAAVLAWLETEDWLTLPVIRIDDSHVTGERRALIAAEKYESLAMVSGGDRVAFRGRHHGRIHGSGEIGWLHVSGLVEVRDGKVVGGHAIRDREGLRRRQRDVAEGRGSPAVLVGGESR